MATHLIKLFGLEPDKIRLFIEKTSKYALILLEIS